MKPPRPSRRLLLLAALLSLGSHWLLLRGVDLPDFTADSIDSASGSTVMLATLPAPPAPRLQRPAAAKPPAATPSPSASGIGHIADATDKAGDKADHKTHEELPGDAADNAAGANEKSQTSDEQNTKEVAPQSGQLQFQVFLGEPDGEALAAMTHTFRFSDGHYEISSRGEALGFMALLYSGLLTQHSSGVWDGQGFSTRQYSEQRGKKPEARVTVNADRQEAVFSNGNVTNLPDAHVHDRLSVMYQLGLQLQAVALPARLPAMNVLSSSALESWQFVQAGTEKLSFGQYNIDTRHFRRQNPDGVEKTAIDIWYDTGSDPWPVQIRLTDKKGMVITQKRVLLGYAGKKTGK